MTLVVSLSGSQSAPFMISDTLLTATVNKNSSPEVDYPTIPSKNIKRRRRVVGLCQKIIEIRPNLYIGWSGDYIAAGRFISHMRFLFKSQQTSCAKMSEECKTYFRFLRPEDICTLSIIILYYENDLYHRIVANSAILTSHEDFGDVTVIGSGSRPFLNYINEVPLAPVSDNKYNAPFNANKIQYCLSYIALTLNYQKSTGFGIPEGWGGSFEIVLSKTGNSLEKLDRIMYLTFVWWVQGVNVQTSWVGSRYFYYSKGNRLNIFSQERHKGLKKFVALPPDCPAILGEQTLSIEERSPQMVCMHLINRDTQKSRTILIYAETGHLYFGISALPIIGESIRANSDCVMDLIRRLAMEDAT